MAKLSARGRVEVARFERVRKSGEPGHREYEVRKSYAVMSDGRVLEKTQIRDDGPYGTGKWRPGTWRLWKRIKSGNTFRGTVEGLDKLCGPGKVSRPDLLDTVAR